MFRLAEKADIDKVAFIYDDIHRALAVGEIESTWRSPTYPNREVAEEGLERGDLFVLEVEGEIVGTMILNKNQGSMDRENFWPHEVPADEVMVIHTLAVAPKQINHGYGTQIMQFYEKYALENGCSCLRLCTGPQNKRAQRLYRRCGFQEVPYDAESGHGGVFFEKMIK